MKHSSLTALDIIRAQRRLASRLSPQARRLAFPVQEKSVRAAPVKRRLGEIKPAAQNESPAQKAYAARAHTKAVIATCAAIWDVPRGMLADPARLKEYVLPRRAAMSLMHTLLKLSLPAIGCTLDRDHTSVLAALRRHAVIINFDLIYSEKYVRAKSELSVLFNIKSENVNDAARPPPQSAPRVAAADDSSRDGRAGDVKWPARHSLEAKFAKSPVAAA